MNHRNDNFDDGPVLLIARVTREQRWTYLVLASFALVTGLALFGLGVLLIDVAMIALPVFFCAAFLLFGALFLLDRPYIRGDIYGSVIANSKTIAVKYRRGRIRILKRRDCIACDESGNVLFDREGRRYPIVVRGPLGYDHAGQFLRPFYALWWPGTKLESIRQHALANSCGISTTLPAILLGNVPLFLAIYACLFHNVHMIIAFAAACLLTSICEWVVLRTNFDGTWSYRYPLVGKIMDHSLGHSPC